MGDAVRRAGWALAAAGMLVALTRCDAGGNECSDASPCELDASTARDGGPNTGVKALPDAGDAKVSCEDTDGWVWAAAHEDQRLVDAMYRCSVASLCSRRACSYSACVRTQLNVRACDTCVERELTCIADRCGAECAGNAAWADCLACACARGCPQRFAECEGTARPVCACTVQNRCQTWLSPAILSVVVD